MEEKKGVPLKKNELKAERKDKQKERERRGCRKREWNKGRMKMEEKKRESWKKGRER